MTNEIAPYPSQFGRYEVLGLIGSGSFADVVRAWDAGLASHVAIKILNLESADNELARTRFIEEGQLLRRVTSPNVLSVHDIGELEDGRPYLVVDLADGGTLDERIEPLEGQPVDVETVRRVVESLAAGLNAMHDAGVVHRDIKPENLLVATAGGPPPRGPEGAEVRETDDPTSEPAPATVVTGLVFGDRERLLIGDLGLAKDLVNRGSSPSVIGGSARYQAPEQLRADGMVGPPTDLYAASAVLWRLLSGRTAPEPHDLADAVTRFRPRWQAFFERAMALEPRERFENALAWGSAVLDLLEAQPNAVAAGNRTMVAARACPYKGLAAFQPEDAEVFFGRDELVEELLRRLQIHRVLVVAGPSGSGKSSAIRAGLLPALRNDALPGSERWRYELFTPGSDPFDELHYRLTRGTKTPPRITAAELEADPRQARRLLDDASAERGTEQVPLMVYIDQFEEVFTQSDDPDRPRAFVDALSAMTDPADSRLRLVLAVRADFYGRCAQIPWLAQRITENQILVGPMSDENIRRAIEEPARRHGLRLEAGLVDAVLDEGGRGAGSLPLISHALVETWSRRNGNQLTLEGFRDAGGVGGAIAQSADKLFEAMFDERQQQAAKRLLLRLITPGEGTPDTRRRLPFEELQQDMEPEVMASVIDEFVSARLLAVDDKTVEIAHEALIVGWPRLRDWIDSERGNLRFRHRVSRAATEWEGAERDPDLLWRGTPLATAVDWASEHRGTLNRLEQDFIDGAEHARIEAENTLARREARSQRNRRLATGALAALALASVLASVVAFVAFRRASNNNDIAERQFANALGTSAVGQARSDPRQALLLAMESRERSMTATVDARAAMVQARLAMAEPGLIPYGPPISTPGSIRVALRPDGLLAAVSDSTGTIRLYDTVTGDQVGAPLKAHDKGARTITFTPDGEFLLSGASDDLVFRWDLSDPAEVPEPALIIAGKVIVWSVAVHPDEPLAAVAMDDGTIRLFDLDRVGEGGSTAGLEPLRVLEWKDRSGGITVAAFSPDGSKLVASNRSGRVNGWDTTSWEELWDPMATPEGAKLWEIAFSPDGTLFATAGDSAAAHIHNAETGLPIDGLTFGAQEADESTGGALGGSEPAATFIHGPAFSADGSRFIGGSAAGTVHTWLIDDPTAPPTVSSTGHNDAVKRAQISADGTIYATVGDDKRLRIWLAGGTPVAERFSDVPDGAHGAAFDPSGDRLAVGGGDGRLHIFVAGDRIEAGSGADRRRGAETDVGHDGQVWDVVWSPDGTWLASIGEDGKVVLWDGDGRPLADIGQHQGEGRTLAVSTDGTYLVSSDRGDDDGQGADVFIWAVATRSLHKTLPPHDQGVRAIDFSPDGRLLATADGRGEVRIWDTDDFSLQRQWSAGDNKVWAVSFSRDGMLASVDTSEDVRVFDPATGDQLGITVSGLGTGGGAGVGFDADGQTVAVITRKGELLLLDWQQGTILLPSALDAHTGEGAESFELVFDAEGSRFATTDTDGGVRVWDLLSPERACEHAAQRLDPSIEADLFDGVTPVACSEP